MRATRNGVSPTTNYVTVEKSRQCHTSSTLSIDQVWRRSATLTWSRWGCRRLGDNIRLLAHDNNNNEIHTAKSPLTSCSVCPFGTTMNSLSILVSSWGSRTLPSLRLFARITYTRPRSTHRPTVVGCLFNGTFSTYRLYRVIRGRKYIM